MATSPIRVYFVVNVGTLSPNESQWRSLFQQMKTKILENAILKIVRAAQNDITFNKRSQNASALLKNTLCGFEIDPEDVDDLVTVLNSEAAKISSTGNSKQKFTDVMQNDMRVSARDLGYTVNQSNQLTCAIVGFGNRDTAIAQAQSYLASNPGIWYS